MPHGDLTEKDLDVEEKKVFGRIIYMWSFGDPSNPYSYSTQSAILEYAVKDGLTEERALKILKDLEERDLIQREESKGQVRIKYRVEAAHIVRELQKTTYVNSRDKFKPPHR